MLWESRLTRIGLRNAGVLPSKAHANQPTYADPAWPGHLRFLDCHDDWEKHAIREKRDDLVQDVTNALAGR